MARGGLATSGGEYSFAGLLLVASARRHAAGLSGSRAMSLSSAKNYALRAAKSVDQKEAAELLSKAILELAAAIEATDAKIKKINKSG
jgi:hypothetical protein